MIYYVYRHIRPDTGKPFYIGIGKKANNYQTIKQEYARAFDAKKGGRNRHWLFIYNKYGRDVEILIDNLTKTEAIDKEIEFIKLYGRGDKNGLLVNYTDGGEGLRNWEPSDETRRKMRMAHLGTKMSDFHRKRQKEGIAKSKTHNKNHKKKKDL